MTSRQKFRNPSEKMHLARRKFGSIISKNHFLNPFCTMFWPSLLIFDENPLKRLFCEWKIPLFPPLFSHQSIPLLLSNKKKKTQRTFVINYPKVLSSDKHSYCHSSFVTLQQTSEWNFWHLKRRKNGAIVCQNVWVLLSGVVLHIIFYLVHRLNVST